MPLPPFTLTGVDFDGPFVTLNGKQLSKSYLALFVRFTTKAIHLELTSCFSSQSCFADVRQFCARRGAPARTHSDNGINLVGIKNELRQLQMNLTKKFGKKSMPNAADEIGIIWTTIPPGAPLFGGHWKSGVEVAKSHLRRVMGNNVLTYEEISSLLCDIEAILNTRPLLPISTDVLDLRVLTSAMMVTGK